MGTKVELVKTSVMTGNRPRSADLSAEKLAALDSLDTGVGGGSEDVTREALGREITVG